MCCDACNLHHNLSFALSRMASIFVEIGGDRLVDLSEVFEPVVDDKMRQLKCLSPPGIGFLSSWQNDPVSENAAAQTSVEDYSSLLYGKSVSGDGSIVPLSSQSLPSLGESEVAIVGAMTYTMVAIKALDKNLNVQTCIDTLSEVFCMNKERTWKLYTDLSATPCVAHLYSRNLQPEMNPFYKQKAFENDQLLLETKQYKDYLEQGLAITRNALSQVVEVLYLTVGITRYKVTSDSSAAAVGPAAKVDKRTFFVEVQVSSHIFIRRAGMYLCLGCCCVVVLCLFLCVLSIPHVASPGWSHDRLSRSASSHH